MYTTIYLNIHAIKNLIMGDFKMKSRKVLFLSLLIFAILCFAFFIKINKKPDQLDTSITKPITNSTLPIDKNEEVYSLKPNIVYYVLTDEYFENNDKKNRNVSELIRQFMCYDGIKNNIYPDTRSIALDKVTDIYEFRGKLLKEYPTALKLPSNTIVSVNVLNKWQSQNYDTSSSYSDKSPKNLTLSKIK